MEVLVPRFDTYATFQDLQAHGLSAEQATGITAALGAALDATGQTVATKADLEIQSTTLRGELRELRVLMESRFQTIDARFTFTHWMIGIAFTVLFGLSLGNLWLLINLLSRLPKP